MIVEYEFTIFIEPCLVSTYLSTLEVTDISYNIGAPEILGVGSYIFVEDPVCGYPETVTLTNLPIFVLHNSLTSDDFTVPYTNDLELIGSYVVTIKSEICVPNDYTQGACTVMLSEHDFTVFMEPCLVTNYDATTVVDVILYNVN